MTPIVLPKKHDLAKELLASIDPVHGSLASDLMTDFRIKTEGDLRSSFGSHSTMVAFHNAPKECSRVVRFVDGQKPYATLIAESYWAKMYKDAERELV